MSRDTAKTTATMLETTNVSGPAENQPLCTFVSVYFAMTTWYFPDLEILLCPAVLWCPEHGAQAGGEA